MIIPGVAGLVTVPTFVFGAMVMGIIYCCRKPREINDNNSQSNDLSTQLLSDESSETSPPIKEIKTLNGPTTKQCLNEEYFSNNTDTTPLSNPYTKQYSTDKPFDWSRKSNSPDDSENLSDGDIEDQTSSTLTGEQNDTQGNDTTPQSPTSDWVAV